MDRRPRQRLDVYSFRAAQIRRQLNLPAIPHQGSDQLSYLASYAGELGCRSILIERHYIDRDYIEDHGLFYSKSLYPYDNYCQRVHFFKTTASATERRFAELSRSALQGPDLFHDSCDEFSESDYLGFSVIKPLTGSPVGRTVFRTFSEKTDDQRRRLFPCIRTYIVHVNGVSLRVSGLPFQEQDVGVSACATTAIWCALQKLQQTESLAPATPAQITTMASRFALPFGRVLPADEGLSNDQMCQAIQALGASPSLLVATDHPTTRGYLYSALRSGMAPIVIMQNENDLNSFHAVTAVGMRLLRAPVPDPTTPAIVDVSSVLEAIYVHDDRTGPYLRANLVRRPDGNLRLNLLRRRQPEVIDPWLVRHVLVPSHQKIRLSFPGLRKLAADLVGWVHTAGQMLLKQYDAVQSPVSFETWVTRSHEYVEGLYFNDALAGSSTIRNLVGNIAFPRYLGVIRLRSPRLDVIDVLVDTTSTIRNLHYVAVVPLKPGHLRNNAAFFIAQVCNDAPLVF